MVGVEAQATPTSSEAITTPRVAAESALVKNGRRTGNGIPSHSAAFEWIPTGWFFCRRRDIKPKPIGTAANGRPGPQASVGCDAGTGDRSDTTKRVGPVPATSGPSGRPGGAPGPRGALRRLLGLERPAEPTSRDPCPHAFEEQEAELTVDGGHQSEDAGPHHVHPQELDRVKSQPVLLKGDIGAHDEQGPDELDQLSHGQSVRERHAGGCHSS